MLPVRPRGGAPTLGVPLRSRPMPQPTDRAVKGHIRPAPRTAAAARRRRPFAAVSAASQQGPLCSLARPPPPLAMHVGSCSPWGGERRGPAAGEDYRPQRAAGRRAGRAF